jgi:hypothetical protein
VTIVSVIGAVGSMSHLTSLDAEALSGGWSATKVRQVLLTSQHARGGRVLRTRLLDQRY